MGMYNFSTYALADSWVAVQAYASRIDCCCHGNVEASIE